MLDRCFNCLTGIAVSIIIAIIFTILFYTGIIIEIGVIFKFSLAISIVSLLLIGLLGISDNGLTRQRLWQNGPCLIASIVGNILFNLVALTITLTAGAVSSAAIVAVAIFFFIFNLFSLIRLLLDIINYN